MTAVCRPALWGGRPSARFAKRRQLDQVVCVLDAEHLAQHVEHGRMEVLHPALRFDETEHGALADALLAGQSPLDFHNPLGELRGGRSRRVRTRHEFGQTESHVQHATTVVPLATIVNSRSETRGTGAIDRNSYERYTTVTQTETDMRHTRMVSTRQVPTYVTGNGVLGICPTCGEPNVAEFGKDGNLVWWPNAEVGKWCRHAQGAYQGARLVETVMQFVYLPLVATGRYGEPAA